MSDPTSVLEALLQVLPELRPSMFFKSSLTALSHAMEDQVLAGNDQPLVIASFQQERFYRQETSRYLRIAEHTQQVYVLAAPETDFSNRTDRYEMVAFGPGDGLSQEWHLVVLGQRYASCLICRERTLADDLNSLHPDQSRRFEGFWSLDRAVVTLAAQMLLARIQAYRPELAAKIDQAQQQFALEPAPQITPGPFAERLVTYLQAGQYKLIKAYRSIAENERKERLVNSMTAAIRRSLQLEDILQMAVQELGQGLGASRCLVYPCQPSTPEVTVQQEFLQPGIKSLLGKTWPLAANPLFQMVCDRQELAYLDNTQTLDPDLAGLIPRLQVQQWQIQAWLMVPVIHQGQILGMVELHNAQLDQSSWRLAELELVEAIAVQLGVALLQSQSYQNLTQLNQQLEALDVTRSNLIAITGHELRTPLSTIQVCLESLANEPDMPWELRDVMLQTALSDAERMRKLIQDFLTLSELESGRVRWHIETLQIAECVDLAISSLSAGGQSQSLPQIQTLVSVDLPPVETDGEWVVQVLAKLLDNACKFTPAQGRVTLLATVEEGPPQSQPPARWLKVTVQDTGRGIEPDRLESVFERFYQEEDFLRRSAGGTGLGLAICRQIVTHLGGAIWAESVGKNQGSQFHFTLPLAPLPSGDSLESARSAYHPSQDLTQIV
jgi:DICT domain-containing protein/signal transduction histidine kinase